MKSRLCFLSLLLLVFKAQSVPLDEVVLWERNYERPEFRELVIRALEKTIPEYGNYSLKSSLPMEQGTAFANLARGARLNVAIAGTTPEREAALATIFIPVDKGLLGFRLCLVKQQNREAFANITSLMDFHKSGHVIGVGTHWPDRHIIESNGLKTMHSEFLDNLFNMMEFDRFSCFLRSVNEIEAEILANQHRGYIDEQHIAMLYPAADFVFVSKQHSRIKARIEQGILISIEDGDFDRHFERYYANALRRFNFFNRKMLFLTNPDISPEAKAAINFYGLASFAG
ncbi:hypothetical protein [Planctobacterium marinum]|uniref:Solute-binding protein family 3/N-terminal domain-containing protein n=1 Tax=Planctobacterium marinum TaxID=1631968 RepID=A0AA48HLK0_9ALTE|nr:hypothetical protein MACH26_25370 [Planctobacterium marinum]